MNAAQLDLPADFSGAVEFKLTTTTLVKQHKEIVTYTYYFNEGILHRENGPAVLLKAEPHQWFIEGIEFTEKEFQQWVVKKELNKKLNCNLKPKQKQRRLKI